MDNDFTKNWYDLWMKQTKEFFASAEKNLADLFETTNSQEQMKLFNLWLKNLKTQWNNIDLSKVQASDQNYWKTMMQWSMDACDLMAKEFAKQNKDDKPLKTIQELYELWLKCFNEIYQKSLQSQNYQAMYADFMKAAMKFWQSQKRDS